MQDKYKTTKGKTSILELSLIKNFFIAFIINQQNAIKPESIKK